MNYQQAIENLYDALPMYQRIGSAAYKADLENAHRLDAYLNYPHRQFKSIHVAGTNGKGSVSHILSSVLQTAGYKTGLYTSPHLLDFRERIRINGKLIEKNFVTEFTQKNLSFFKKIKASFFEMTVFMAFDYFANKKVDIAIIEVGLGGRLDTTNIITPELSIITNIGLDHTQFLGNDVGSIAFEKAGIIKPKVPVVIGQTQSETQPVFNRIATKNKSSIVFADQLFESDYRLQNMDHSIRYHFKKSAYSNIYEIDTDLIGIYQKENIITALTSLKIINEKELSINEYAIRKGIRNVTQNSGIAGRWQEIKYNPLVVCDTAHNAEGFAMVLSQIKNTVFKSLYMILGFVSDKPIKEIVSQLLPEAKYLLVEPNIPRAMKNDGIIPFFRKNQLNYQTFESIAEALTFAQKNAGINDMIFVGGSTFLVADFLKLHRSIS
jgi:dihydrofolate synthase/folylpolyglutamate synthase